MDFNNISIEWDSNYSKALAHCLKTFDDVNDRFSKSRTPRIGPPGPRFGDLRVDVLLQRIVDRNLAVPNAVIDEITTITKISRVNILKQL